MTSQEKAKQLIDKYRIELILTDTEVGEELLCTSIAKKCASICIDEILNANPYECDVIEILHSNIPYWEAVKNEIEKL